MEFYSEKNILVSVLTKIVCVYQIAIIVFGFIANLLSFLISNQIKKSTTFVFLSFTSLVNLFTLIHWNMESFMPVLFDVKWNDLSEYICKLGNFIQFTALQTSVWLTVLCSVDQCLSVKMKVWRTTYFKPKQAYLVCSLIILFFALANTYVLFKFGHKELINETQLVICEEYSDSTSIKLISAWSQIHSIIYSILPFVILAVSNSILICNLIRTKRGKIRRSRNSKKGQEMSSVNGMVICQAFLFILMTFPSFFISFFYFNLLQTNSGLLFVKACNAFSCTFHAIGFLIYIVTNKQFRVLFLHFFSC